MGGGVGVVSGMAGVGVVVSENAPTLRRIKRETV